MSDKLGAPWIGGEVGVTPRVIDAEGLPAGMEGLGWP